MEVNDNVAKKFKKMPLREQMSVSFQILTFARQYIGIFLIAMLLSIGSSIVTVSMPRIIKIFIDEYLSTHSATLRVGLIFTGIYLLLLLLQAFFNYFSVYLFNIASEKSVGKIRNHLYTQVNLKGMRFFDQVPTGSIVSRITNDTETLKDFWTMFYSLFEGVMTSASVFVGMYLLNQKMARIFLIFVPITVVVVWYYQVYSSGVYRNLRESLSKLNAKLSENIMGMAIIQYFNQEKRKIKEFQLENHEQFLGRRKMIAMQALLLNPFIAVLESVSLALVFYVLGNQFFEGMLEIGVVYAFTQYSTTFFRPLGMMMENLSQLQDGVISSSRILNMINNRELAPHQRISNDSATIRLGKVEFKNVSFSYDGEHKVLDDVSFTVDPGQTLAIVGHTGSGKSSIINILMRFYEFNQGQILIDDYDIKEIPIETIRNKMGLVLQDAFLFYGDIARNIKLLDDSLSDSQMIEAAEFVNAASFIESYPEKYHTLVVERGQSFSSGQRQLISFARTMIREPQILILDEATASIDSETEAAIQESLNKMRQGRTTIAIAHRLSTIKDANQIIVLDHGKIIESGSLEELLERKGIYYQMYQMQSNN